MSHVTSRRRFLETAAITGTGFWIAGDTRSKAPKSLNGEITFACIGVGGAGWGDLQDAGKAGHVVAICDIDGTALNKAGQCFPGARRYADFRKMFDELGKSIDAVTVSTPDHSHAAAALMAMRLGKHCFCQKPLARTVYESRLMARVAVETRVATQMGNRGTAVNSFRKAAAVVKSGVLGLVKEVHVWTDRPDHWRQGGDRAKSIACPPHVAWDLWLGPAPLRPYAAGYHPFAWHGWWDFGTGALGDMGCHTANLPYMALDLRDPTAVQAKTSGHNGDSYPKWSVIVFEFPARNGRPALKLFWYDGGKLPNEPWMPELKDLFRKELDESRNARKNYLGAGCVVVGEKDRFFVPGDYGGWQPKLSGNKPLPDVQFEQSPGHFEEWVRAIKGGNPAVSNFSDYAGPLSETILLGNLAVWAAAPGRGQRIAWDAENLCSTNLPALEWLIKPAYRKGYTLDA